MISPRHTGPRARPDPFPKRIPALCEHATRAATRPQPGCPVRTVLAWEVRSATEWGTGSPFGPAWFLSLSGQALAVKEQALKLYESEMRPWPVPSRSVTISARRNACNRVSAATWGPAADPAAAGWLCAGVHEDAGRRLRGAMASGGANLEMLVFGDRAAAGALRGGGVTARRPG